MGEKIACRSLLLFKSRQAAYIRRISIQYNMYWLGSGIKRFTKKGQQVFHFSAKPTKPHVM